MNEPPITFGILGSGNMARVYGDALTTQVPDGRLTAIALGTRAHAAGGRVRGRRRGVDRGPRRPGRRRRRRHRHAALDPPAAGAGRGRRRQARLPREADGPRRRRVRPDHRRLPGDRRAADDRQADPPHGDVDARQGVHRRGPDRPDPVPAADERHARAPASRTSRRAGRPTRARATRSSTGAPMPATRSAGSPAPTPSAPTPTTTTSPGCRSRTRP